MPHIVLLGDSVFDNLAYTKGAPDVAAHLRTLLPSTSVVTLCAVDGATTHDVAHQFDRVPRDVTHLVLSLGGNNALMNADLLDLPVRSTAEALDLFRDRVTEFETSYGHALEALSLLARPATVCTIYHGDLGLNEATRAATALALFNDVILRTALRYGANVIDLRFVCDQPSDFANTIEPSGTGGHKIAAAIINALEPYQSGARRSVLTGG